MAADKRLQLKFSTEECRTLREMGIYHPHARTQMRAQGMFRLAQGLTLQPVADEFEVHLNSVENCRRRWNEFGLVGLFEGGSPDDRRSFPTRSGASSAIWPAMRAAPLGHCSGNGKVGSIRRSGATVSKNI
jgi:hypothetical protein